MPTPKQPKQFTDKKLLPHEAIRMSLRDIKKVMNLPGFRIDMDHWLNIEVDGKGAPKCSLCLAGSIMAVSLKAVRLMESPSPIGFIHPRQQVDGCSLDPYSFKQPIAGRLDAINHFRIGHITQGLRIFYDASKIRWPLTQQASEKIEEAARRVFRKSTLREISESDCGPHHIAKLKKKDSEPFFRDMRKMASMLKRLGH